jgi:hypothetical protein
MMDTVNHIMNLKPEDIDDIELLRAHNYLNTAKKEYPGNMSDQNRVRDVMKGFGEKAYKDMAHSEHEAKEKAIYGDNFPEDLFSINEQTYNTVN